MKAIARVGVGLLGLSALVAAPEARAEQFVLLDVTFTFTKADADNATPSKSHYYVKSDRLNMATPIDWTKPIDYRNGRVHVRTEVMDKPAGSAETRWTLCYIARKGIDDGYGCSNTAAYKEEGIWEFEQGMTEWWQNDNIDWTQGIKQMDLVMKDSKGVFAHTMPDPERWFPTTLRITMVQVSEGSTYDPSLVPGIGEGGAGTGGAGGSGGTSNAGTGGAVAGGTGGSATDPVSGGAGGGTAGVATGGMPSGGAPGIPAAGAPNGGAGGGAAGAVSGSAAGGGASTTPPSDDASCAIGAARGGGSAAFSLLGLALSLVRLRRRLSRPQRAPSR